MYTIDDVLTVCDYETYRRAMILRRSEMNRRLQYFESGGTVSLIADIYDPSDHHTYHTRASLNDRTGFLMNCECSCTAFRKTEEVCEHIASALIMYADARQSGRIRIGRNGPRPSDPSLLSLIEQFPAEEKRPDTSHSVLVRPILTIDPRTHSLHAEFRIGRTGQKSYVLKNIHTLLSAIQAGEEIIYGKDLSLIPSLESFTEDSLPLVQWLYGLDMVSSSYRESPDWWSYSSSRQENSHIARELVLSGRFLDDFLELLGTSLPECSLYNGRNGSTGLWYIQDGPSPVSSGILQEDRGWLFTLNVPDRMEGTRWLYFIDEENRVLNRVPRSESLMKLLQYTDAHGTEPVYIAARDIAAFTRRLWPVLSAETALTSSGFDPYAYLPLKPSFEIYLDMPQDNTISAELYAVYGQNKYSILDSTQSGDGKRSYADEKDFDDTVSPWFNSFDPDNHRLVLINDDDRLYNLLTEGIPAFRNLAEVYVSDRLKRVQIRSTPTVHLGVSVSGDLLQLDLFTNTLSMDELAEILSRYDTKKKYYRLKNGDFIAADQDAFGQLARLREDMDLSSADIRSGTAHLPKYRAALLEEDLSASSLSFTREQTFRDLLRSMETLNIGTEPVPERWNGILREYQKKGYQWLCSLAEQGFGALLADEMGLGKTVQVIAWLAEHREKGKALIVCPASLVYNWASEFHRFTPEMNVCRISGSAAMRKVLLEEIDDYDVLITSYDLIKRDQELYRDLHFAAEIIDEAQYIKNAGTHAARSVKSISADFRIALTGTPIENRLSELWSIFDYLMPGFLYSYRRFRSIYENPIVKDKDTAVQARLQAMISPFTLRRLKKDVLDDLPEKTEEVYYAPLEDEQQELYTARMQSLRLMLSKQSEEEFRQSRIAVLAELTRLRQLCCSPALIYDRYRGNSAKEDLCLEVVRNAVESGHKVLLFSQFTTMLDRLCSRLTDTGIAYHLLTGSTSQQERAAMVESFAHDDIPVFCISLKAGGTGLNLTAADIVVHYDPWWNTAVENQASDRAHRIGQKNPVTVYRLIMKDTVEERILALQQDKAGMAEQILNAEEIGASTITREQLLSVLK